MLDTKNPAEMLNFRMRLGISQHEMGIILHTTGTTVCRWESGFSVPSPSFRRALINLYNERFPAG